MLYPLPHLANTCPARRLRLPPPPGCARVALAPRSASSIPGRYSHAPPSSPPHNRKRLQHTSAARAAAKRPRRCAAVPNDPRSLFNVAACNAPWGAPRGPEGRSVPHHAGNRARGQRDRSAIAPAFLAATPAAARPWDLQQRQLAFAPRCMAPDPHTPVSSTSTLGPAWFATSRGGPCGPHGAEVFSLPRTPSTGKPLRGRRILRSREVSGSREPIRLSPSTKARLAPRERGRAAKTAKPRCPTGGLSTRFA
jgi:hypothetical protein